MLSASLRSPRLNSFNLACQVQVTTPHCGGLGPRTAPRLHGYAVALQLGKPDGLIVSVYWSVSESPMARPSKTGVVIPAQPKFLARSALSDCAHGVRVSEGNKDDQSRTPCLSLGVYSLAGESLPAHRQFPVEHKGRSAIRKTAQVLWEGVQS